MSNKVTKACPFCGGAAWVKVKSFDAFNTVAYVECELCGARTKVVEEGPKVPSYIAIEKARELWNQRESYRK